MFLPPQSIQKTKSPVFEQPHFPNQSQSSNLFTTKTLSLSLSNMGNYVSCSLSSPSSSNISKSSIRVVFPKTGEIKQFKENIKAAELMLESPNTFLVNSLSLHPGRRFSALNADEDLERGNVYVVFPMKRVNSVITAADMGALFLTAKRVAGVRVLPEPEQQEEEAPARVKLNLDDIDDFSVTHRLSICRSKKPLLETIAEEPVCFRR